MRIDVLAQHMKRRGYKVVGNRAYGVEGGFPLIVQFTQGLIDSVALAFTTGENAWKSIKKELKEATKSLGSPSWAGNHLNLSLTANDNNISEKYSAAVQTVLEVFLSAGVRLPVHCQVCGAGEFDKTFRQKEKLMFPSQLFE